MLSFRTILVILLCVSSSVLVHSQTFQAFINRVNSAEYSERTAIVDSFMAAHPQLPFYENDSTVHFIYRGSATTVSVPGDANGWNASSFSMNKLSTTDLWYLTKKFEPDARLDYKFSVNGSSNLILDPKNPNRVSGGYGPNSELAMPLYIQPWEIKKKTSVSHGTRQTIQKHSSHTSVSYTIYVYLPPQYFNDTTKRFPTAYFQDGSDYLFLAKADTIIDNLIDGNKIEPVIGIFVKPTNREQEYASGKRTLYRLFFIQELVPFIDSLYRTILDPSRRLVLGDSWGGNISALIAYNHPDVFGNCGLHSCAFWRNNYEAYNLIVNGLKKEVTFVSIWGTYESLYDNMRKFRDSLLNKGYAHRWREHHEGHSWGLWRATLDVILESIFPAEPVVVNESSYEKPTGVQLFQNYPNPFNPSTVIRYSLPVNSVMTLTIFNMLGQEVATLLNKQEIEEGEYELPFHAINLPSGVYFYKLQTETSIQTKRMILLK